MAQLRAPEGCPWDKEQTHKSLKKNLLEETYELLDAIESEEDENMIDELGDVLLQVVFHSQIGKEGGRFDFETVARQISEKLIRRHPHVFGDKKISNSDDVVRQWENIKKTEKAETSRQSVLDGIPRNMPPLAKAEKIQIKASRAGFDWRSAESIVEKIEEELLELKQSLGRNDRESVNEELGDLLFSVINLARFKGESTVEILEKTIKKFYNRFRYIEKEIEKSDLPLEETSIEKMELLWQQAKQFVG